MGIEKNLKSLLELQSAPQIALYMPYQNEASALVTMRLTSKTCFPKVIDPAGAMIFVEAPASTANFVRGAFGILEPPPGAPEVPLSAIDLCFLPLLAFDHTGTRLGMGKGFYDRALEHYCGKKIGVAFDCQESKELLPSEEHDQKLDLVVTESRILRF